MSDFARILSIPRVALPSADRGLVHNSQILAIADGALGLFEALEAGFPNLQFIARSPSSQTTSV